MLYARVYKLSIGIWKIIDYKDFYGVASQRTVDEFIRGWSDSTLSLRVPRGTLAPISSVRERWRRTFAFFREREEIKLERKIKDRAFDLLSIRKKANWRNYSVPPIPLHSHSLFAFFFTYDDSGSCMREAQ